MPTRKEKEIVCILSDAVYVVVSGVFWDRFIPTKVFPGRHTYKECEEIIRFQQEKWKRNPPKQRSKNSKFHIAYVPPSFEIHHYKKVPKI